MEELLIIIGDQTVSIRKMQYEINKLVAENKKLKEEQEATIA